MGVFPESVKRIGREYRRYTGEMVFVLDNYDSFTYNLVQYLGELGAEVEVRRNDQVTTGAVAAMRPERIVISPGPCTPQQAGISIELIQQFAGKAPILGVCLGHQALAAALGGNVIRAPEPVHGRTSLVQHNGTRLFAGLPNPLKATRYHSLIVEEASLTRDLRVTARTSDGIPMALEHTTWPVFGVQFHPESILTDSGHRLLANFLMLAGVPSGKLPEGDRAANLTESNSIDDSPSPAQPLHW